jgi:hypothetical protein
LYEISKKPLQHLAILHGWGETKMKTFPVMALCCCALLAACSDKQPSACVGGSKGMSIEGMSDIDKYFMTTDFNKYIGLTLGDLDRDFAIQYQKRSGITQPPMRLIGIGYSFPNNYSLDVYFSDIKYTQFNSKTNKWDFRKINNETVSGMRIKHYGSGDYYFCKEMGDVRL